MLKRVSFNNHKGEVLRGVVHVPKNYAPKNGTAIIRLHGFPGSGMGMRSAKLANAFMREGFLALRFDFSGSSTSGGEFEDKLMSQEVKEVKLAIDFIEKNFGFKKLVLMGHSTGAIDASLYAHKDKRINKLILSGAVSDLKHGVNYDFNALQVRDFWDKGFIIYNKKRNKKKTWFTGKRLKKTFYDEFFTLDIAFAMKKFKRPLLIIHGEKDTAIPSNKDPVELYKICNKPKKLVIVKDAGHNFKGKKQTINYLNELIKFVKRN